jgi:hypothetical protein
MGNDMMGSRICRKKASSRQIKRNGSGMRRNDPDKDSMELFGELSLSSRTHSVDGHNNPGLGLLGSGS